MDQQVVIVDQFTTAMASIQEALANLRQEIGSQQSRQLVVQNEMSYDSLPPLLPPPSPTMPQAPPYLLHGHSDLSPPAVVQTIALEDTHTCMDCIEQRIRQLRVSDSLATQDDLEGILVDSLLAKFGMPDIERYKGVGCPRIHLRLYITMMRAHGLDESQMITLFPLSLS